MTISIGNQQNNQSMFTKNNMQRNQAGKDSILQGIQKQISKIEEGVKKLSGNQEISMEEKQVKRKELMQQIIDLKKQMHQREIEIQKEEREKKAKKIQEDAEKKLPQKEELDDLSKVEMSTIKKIIGAGHTISQVKAQNSVRTKMKGEVRVLESEIKLDEGRGCDATKKKEKLADLKVKIEDITSQLGKQFDKVNEEITREDTPKNSVGMKMDNEDNKKENGNSFIDIKL